MFCMPRSACRIPTLLLSACPRGDSRGMTTVLGRSAPRPQVATMLCSASKAEGAKETTGKAFTRHCGREGGKTHVPDEEGPHVLDGVELVAVPAEVVFVAGGDDVEAALLQDVAEVDERVRGGRWRVEQHRGPPVFGVVFVAVELEEQLADRVVEERLRDVAPLLARRRQREVDEHHDQTHHADQRLPTAERGFRSSTARRGRT